MKISVTNIQQHCVLAIDPGLSGGASILLGTADDNEILRSTTLPFKKDKYDKPILDIKAFRSWIVGTVGFAGYVFIETPQSRPNESYKSTATSWWCLGQMHSVLAELTDRIEYVPPQRWKIILKDYVGSKGLVMPTNREEWKKLSVDYVSEVYGRDKLVTMTKLAKPSKNLHDGIADSVVIARWGLHVLEGKIVVESKKKKAKKKKCMKKKA